jgi:hypothetical protein
MRVQVRRTVVANPKSLLSVTGAVEAVTGLALLAAPLIVVELLLGAGPGTAAGVTVSRVAGLAVLALGIACWLGRQDATGRAANGLVLAMLLYNVAVVAILVLAYKPEAVRHRFLAGGPGSFGAVRLVRRELVDAPARRHPVLEESLTFSAGAPGWRPWMKSGEAVQSCPAGN